MKRTLLFVVLAIIIAGAWYGYREYNRKNVDLKTREAEVSISATSLIAAFEKDTAAANREYVDKIIAVSGNVKSIDAHGNPVVIALGQGDQMSSVQCSMDSAYAGDYKPIKEGDQLTLKGICTGGRTEEMFGTDVILNRCVLENKK